MTTDAHPDLADMVNDVKRTHGTGARGPFYINEYKQVIVPVGDEVQYYYAGTYKAPLRFEFEGKTISGEPLNHSRLAAPAWRYLGGPPCRHSLRACSSRE